MKNRIQELRHEKGLTVHELAQALEIPTQILSEYETGITPLTVDALMKIAKYFDVPMGYVVYAK